MEIEDYLKDEMKRLNRMNDLLENTIKRGRANCNEPEQIVDNVKAICELANIIYYR